ncbi:alkaline phosphatase family protein [Terrimonas sp.]|uniref:alkaline phosphatase PafA n=1 Tax=Terrimonas sp. TaxID=1914338 RepID=UPI000D513984|nr:alkaline phosphatase PafA [Terrimonas sp.]PVD49745.1 alkaline phosphatase family protein [Terrimonas sp.]PVD49941.1 alkaline phosphatase family protein [Terrimonas sp.]
MYIPQLNQKSRLTLLLGLGLLLSNIIYSQTKTTSATPSQPKIVVGMMVDQMRWDYLYRFQNRYTEGGFKRLIREGFSCENTLIDYSPTITACGHTCVYTGSTPAIHGIVGNDWYDRKAGKDIGCVNDDATLTVGAEKPGRGQSPHNNLVTTVTDQLRIASNYQSKTVGIAIKDRAAILPGGHAATGAFWYNGDGNFITSTYYMKELPEWAKRFNEKKIVDTYYKNDWKTLYPIETYTLSTADDKDYEGTANGEKKPVFPKDLKQFIGKNYGAVRTTPYGNTLTFEFAKAAIEGYDLGGGKFTDFLAISFSSPDAIGHTYGPNSIEQEDDYLRLDKDLADFFNYLDKKFGKGNYLYFITADHGVSESPGYYLENKMPSGAISGDDFSGKLTETLKQKFGVEKPILAFTNYQLYMNWDELNQKNVDRKQLDAIVKSVLLKADGIANVLTNEELGTAAVPEPIKSMMIKGYNVKRSGDYTVVIQPTWKGGSIKGATHGTWYPYDAHIPLVWMGWKIKPGYTNRVTGMTDIAPTVAALLRIQMPSGSIGQPIQEVTGGR